MSILLFVLILLGLVTIHEFGHFIVAKLCGIRVDEFAFGFSPKIFGKKIGETEYKLNLLPIGGYVKIFGEDSSEVDEMHPDYNRSFFRKPRYMQLAVIVAGVFFNILAAWGLFTTTFLLGAETSVDNAPLQMSLTNTHIAATLIAPDSPVSLAGVKVGDTIKSVSTKNDSLSVTDPQELPDFIALHQDEGITLTYIPHGTQVEKSVMLTPVRNAEGNRKIIGLSTDLVGTLKLPFFSAVYEGAHATWVYTKITALGFKDLVVGIFNRTASVSELTGPVGIVGIVDQARQYGIVALLTFTALISINLAVLNLIPFPALDGGRALFIILESIFRRPLPMKFQIWTNTVGFTLLLVLMLVVTYQDIAKLVTH